MSSPRARAVVCAVELVQALMHDASPEVQAEIIRRHIESDDDATFALGALAALVPAAWIAGHGGLSLDNLLTLTRGLTAR